MFGGLLRLLLIPPAEPPFLPVAGQGIFRQLRVILGGGAEVIVRRGLDIFGLGPPDSLCRGLPDFPFHILGAMPQNGLAHKLGAVGSFDAHIFVLVFINLAMHKAVDGAAGHPAHTLNRARLFRRFLFCQNRPVTLGLGQKDYSQRLPISRRWDRRLWLSLE